MLEHQILDASNNSLEVTNLMASNAPTTTFGAVPLGTADNTATGELAAKVKIVGNVAVSSESTAEATAAAPAYTEGQDAPLSQDRAGNLRTSSAPRQLSGVPSNYAVATADGTVFTLAAGERGFIQNLDSADALAVKLGASASTSSFSFILACGSAADDGKGGFVQIDDWIGAVSVATMTGTARYIAWKVA